MFAALYPRNWPKKETGAMNRIVIKEHGIAYYIKKLKEYEHENELMTKKTNQSNIQINSIIDREVELYDHQFNDCVQAVSNICKVKYIGKCDNIEKENKIICNMVKDNMGLSSEYWSSRLERKTMDENATSITSVLVGLKGANFGPNNIGPSSID